MVLLSTVITCQNIRNTSVATYRLLVVVKTVLDGVGGVQYMPNPDRISVIPPQSRASVPSDPRGSLLLGQNSQVTWEKRSRVGLAVAPEAPSTPVTQTRGLKSADKRPEEQGPLPPSARIGPPSPGEGDPLPPRPWSPAASPDSCGRRWRWASGLNWWVATTLPRRFSVERAKGLQPPA
jgi:hypothetical protein